jgi:4-hydroxy-tetrahydrodipicolinate synthase
MGAVNSGAARTPERAAPEFFHYRTGTVAVMPADPVLRPFGSVSVAMVTPFTDSGALDLDAAAALAAGLVDQGCDGLVVSGTTGEAPTTTPAEQDQLLRTVLEAVGGRAAVLAGIGTNDTAHTLELARAAAKAGAHGLLAVTPYYNKPPQTGLLAHFRAIADATDVPVMLYDIPGRSGVPIETETLVRLAEHPRIVAVKDAKGDVYEGAWVMSRCDLAYYSGADELNLTWLAHGAAGLVSVVGHVAATQYRRMVDAVAAGDLITARAVYVGLLPAVRGIMGRTQGAITAKAALQLTGALPGRATRLPLPSATIEEVELLRADLEEAHLL